MTQTRRTYVWIKDCQACANLEAQDNTQTDFGRGVVEPYVLAHLAGHRRKKALDLVQEAHNKVFGAVKAIENMPRQPDFRHMRWVNILADLQRLDSELAAMIPRLEQPADGEL